jgi:hypothetical protein
MKRPLIFIILIFSYLTVFSQEETEEDSITYLKNVVKFLPFNIPFQSVSFEYERMIDPKGSLTVGVGLPIQGRIMGIPGSGSKSNIKNAVFSTMHLRAAYRYYYGNSMLPKGLYIEPYLKYQQIRGNTAYSGIDNLKKTYTGDITGNINTYNLGVQFGIQYLTKKNVSFDLYFLGLEGGLAQGRITSTSGKTADADKIESDFNKAVEDLPFFLSNWLKVEKSSNKVSIEAKKLQYPWLRVGVSIGIAF